MPRLEYHPHSALSQLVENEVVADHEPAALLLVNRRGLIGSELARLDQRARKPEHPLGGIAGEAVELRLIDQPDVDKVARELREARECRGGRTILGIGQLSKSILIPAGRGDRGGVANALWGHGDRLGLLVAIGHGEVSDPSRVSPLYVSGCTTGGRCAIVRRE